jgi:Zn-dependent protease
MPDFGALLLFIVALAFSVSFHEFSHGWMADRLGDPTARFAGRLTMNPMAHVDPVGTLLLPGVMYLLAGVLFGYAKPVPVDPRNLRDPRWDNLKVSLVGPLSNLVLALLSAVLLGVLAGTLGYRNAVGDLLVMMVGLNCSLFIFNLLPIPPLDGSWILDAALPRGAYEAYQRIKPWGMLLLILIIVLPPLSLVLIQMPRQALNALFSQVAQGVAGMVS